MAKSPYLIPKSTTDNVFKSADENGYRVVEIEINGIKIKAAKDIPNGYLSANSNDWDKDLNG